MAGTQTYINPSFPGGSFSAPNPPVGIRSEIFTYRATGNYYTWVVPAGVTYVKAIVVGGGNDGGATVGGTTSLGQYATATGASASGGGAGSFSVTTTRFPQNIGPSFASLMVTNYGFGAGGVGTGSGGQGIVFLQNMVPGTTIRITIGAQGGASAGNGVVILEY